MCLGLAHVGGIFASENKTQSVMKNTEYNLETLENVISTESFRALLDMIGDLGLEVTGVSRQ